MANEIRQGDIVLVPVNQLPEGADCQEPQEKKLEITGETGNVHAFSGIEDMVVPGPGSGVPANVIAVIA